MNTLQEFSGSWALILGGSSGLGLATAKKLAANGMNICIVHRDRKSNLDAFNKEIKEIESNNVVTKTFNKDALTTETIEEVLKSIKNKSIKVLVHSIAKGSVKPMYSENTETLSKQDFTITLNAMALSLYDWSKALINQNKFSSNARIIGFTSEGNTKAWRYYGAVSAAKATLEALMRNMALEFAPLGITTNCLQAGVTETPSFKMIPGSDRLSKFAKKRNPFNKLTTPQDVANVVYLLCKDEASWINGTVIKVDGGESLQ
jgi:enoyl-[acyl-carrier protein] reductase III